MCALPCTKSASCQPMLCSSPPLQHMLLHHPKPKYFRLPFLVFSSKICLEILGVFPSLQQSLAGEPGNNLGTLPLPRSVQLVLLYLLDVLGAIKRPCVAFKPSFIYTTTVECSDGFQGYVCSFYSL